MFWVICVFLLAVFRNPVIIVGLELFKDPNQSHMFVEYFSLSACKYLKSRINDNIYNTIYSHS